jgi:hypothetical protein
MHISFEGKIGIGLALIGLAGAGAMMVAPEDLEIGWSLITIAVVGAVFLVGYHFAGRRMAWIFPWILIVGGPLIGGAWLYFNREIKLPGFTGYAVIRLYDSPEFRRRYVFEFVSSDGARVAFYLSASSVFTFSVTDIRGESYPLEVRLGHGGIPIDKFVALFCEVGVAKNSSILRVIVNEKEVATRKLSFPLNLGKMDWKPGSLGQPLIGVNQGGVFMLTELGIYGQTMTSKEIHALVENVRGFYKQPFD